MADRFFKTISWRGVGATSKDRCRYWHFGLRNSGATDNRGHACQIRQRSGLSPDFIRVNTILPGLAAAGRQRRG
jgi:hypothetical protein